jgi:tetratricopeptide (TPR) repeat protein
MPSTSAYMVAAAAVSTALFFVLWWMLQEEENPWVPAGLAAIVVMLVAASAREVVMRRALTRYLLDDEPRAARHDRMRSGEYRGRPPALSQSEILRGLERQSAEADANNTHPELHLKVFQMCGDFLQIADNSLTLPSISAERRLTVRARQDRVRALQKHHMLVWARNSAQSLTQEAQQRARLHEKIEAANRALECIDTALANYPEEEDLQRSAAAVREFVTTSRVAHWVELAQRASFKGRYSRAIDCYRDALFYLTRAEGDHHLAAEQITREIELLRARRATHSVVETDGKKSRRAREN